MLGGSRRREGGEPGLDKVPVGIVLLEVCGVCGGRPVHEVQVDIVDAERLERRLDALLDALVPWVVELRGDPDLLTRDTGGLDALTDFRLVAVGECAVGESISGLQAGLKKVEEGGRVWGSFTCQCGGSRRAGQPRRRA